MASYPFDLLRTTLAAQGEPKVGTGHGSAPCYPDRLGTAGGGGAARLCLNFVFTAMMRQVYNNMFAAARDIVQNRGFQGLYSGLKSVPPPCSLIAPRILCRAGNTRAGFDATTVTARH